MARRGIEGQAPQAHLVQIHLPDHDLTAPPLNIRVDPDDPEAGGGAVPAVPAVAPVPNR